MKKTTLFKRAIRKLYDYLFDPECLIERKVYKIVNARKTRAYILSKRLCKKYALWIAPSAVIGKGLKLPHYMGVVIGEGAVIGNDCTIYQQVTLGQRDGEYPTLGNNVVVYAGAKILGKVDIGSGAVIGANAVVLRDVPAGAVAAGIPAKIIKQASHIK